MGTKTKGEAAEKPSPLFFGAKETLATAGAPIAANLLQQRKELDMSTTIFEENGCISLGSIDNEEDLVPKAGININPPPQDGRCHCCGRHMSELKPFGKAGDPLVGDFEGALLVKIFRREGPYDEEADSAMEEAIRRYSDEGFKDPLDWLIRKYGEEKGMGFDGKCQLYDSIRSSWECRDCIVLDEVEYFEKLRQHRRQLAENCIGA